METFTQWLVDHGHGDFVYDAGGGDLEIRDGTTDDREGTLQSLFSSQYSAWLQHLVAENGLGADTDGDGVVSVELNQNDPDGTPQIEGMTAEELAGMFGDRESFIWLSSVNPNSGEDTVPHERFYSDSFDSAGEDSAPGGDGDDTGTPGDGGSETFTQWLIDHGYEDYVEDAGEGDLEIRDGTTDDKPGTLQSLFSSQYSAWLQHLLDENGIGDDTDGDGVISVQLNQNDPEGTPEIEGMTSEELAGMFGDRESFIWLSSVNSHSGEHTATHERFYSDSFTFSGAPATSGDGGGAVVSTAAGRAAGGPGMSSNAGRFYSSDTNLAFDLDGAAGNAVRIIGAAFGEEYITPEFVGIGLNLFDADMTKEDVAGLALGTSLFQWLAGSTSNVDFVNHVYENVVGILPAADELDHLVGLLQGSGGTMTQAELLVLAANSDANAQNIDLVGLQQSGVEFV